MGNLGSGPQKSTASEAKKSTGKARAGAKEKTPVPTKSKPVPMKKEKDLVSILQEKGP